jgi:MbtH protein
MIRETNEDARTYKVVVNDEDQYSVWPADRDNASGWIDEGERGTREECLAYIKRVWIDMRPRSLKRRMMKREKAS